MRRLGLASVLCLATACGYESPTDPTPSPANTGPAAVTLTTVLGQGEALITAKVVNGSGLPVRDVLVTFAATSGTLAPERATTDEAGIARTILTANEPASVVARAGSVSGSAAIVPTAVTFGMRLRLDVTTDGPQTGASVQFVYTITPAPESPVLRATLDFGDASNQALDLSKLTGVVNHAYRRSGRYTTVLEALDATGTIVRAERLLQIRDPPPTEPPPPPPGPSYSVALVASPSSVVVTNSATLTATATPANGAPPPATYEWDCNGDGVPDGPPSTATSMVCVYGTVGTVNSRVVVRNGSVNGVGTAAVTVTAGAPLFVNIVPSTFAPVTNTDVILTATVTSTGPVPASFVWYWDMENDGVFEIVVPASASPNAQTTRYGPPGKHTAKVKVVDPTTAREATTTVVLNVP